MCQAVFTPLPAPLHTPPLHLLILLNERCYPKLCCLLLIKCHLLRKALTNNLPKVGLSILCLVIFLLYSIIFIYNFILGTYFMYMFPPLPLSPFFLACILYCNVSCRWVGKNHIGFVLFFIPRA